MTHVLGIHVGHDSAAALVADGQIVACVGEERFNRIKHYAGLPVESIAYCLASAGIRIEDLDAVALTSKGSDGESLRHLMNLDIDTTERGEAIMDRAKSFARDMFMQWRPRAPECPPIYYRTWKTKRPIPTQAIEHHLAHAASAFYTSGRREPTLVITADGIGDGCSVAVWRASPPARFELLYREGGSGSLGWFYSLVTEGLGWWIGDGEGKTMGLAPYGSTRGVEGVLDKFCPRYEGGALVAPHDFGRPAYWSEMGTYHWHFPEAEEVKGLTKEYGREAIAAEAQRVLEREMVPFVRHWLERAGTRVACFAGGLMLNVKMNQRLWESGSMDVQHIFPEAGDAGLAAGAALFVNATIGGPLSTVPLQHCYWGPEYADPVIEALLQERRLRFSRVDDPAAAAAQRLSDGKIVAWFQGRMEAGPRALGGRSILMDPGNAANKDIINARVKFREPFRPFCPSMTPRAARELLDPAARPERFMITSFDVLPTARSRIPAVVHADGTARPQVVEPEQNPLFHRLLVEFGRRAGTECVLNTSFNIRGEPIVCNPREAIRCFYDTGLDSLVLGSYVLDK